MLDELDQLLQISTSVNTQLLSYDTTFQFGDFYVSVLLFRGICFQQSPVMPAMFLIHERKLKTTHQKLVSILAEKVPSLSRCNVTLVTDREKSFEVFKSAFDTITHLHCWNHIFTDIKHWIKSHSGTSGDVAVYIQDVKDSLQCRSEEDYKVLLSEKSKKWSGAFLEYFMTELHPHVNTMMGRWVLEKLRVYNPYSGVTQNMSEGFNTVLRRLENWKEAALDMCVLSFYYLQGYYLNEWKRGLCKTGSYTLLGNYTFKNVSIYYNEKRC
jgi:hypothetical protein